MKIRPRDQEPKGERCKGCPRYGDKRCSSSDLTGPVLDVLFVSAQPDIPSAANNAPMYGHAGRVARAGIDFVQTKHPETKDVHYRFTHAVQCADLKETNASKVVLEKCRHHLESTIALKPPKLIVAMGATALKQLGFKGKFNDVRGRIIHTARVKVPIFVTFSEKALLGQTGLFSAFNLDILNVFNKVLGKGEFEKKSLEEIAKDYVIPQTVDEVKKVCEEIINYCGRGHPSDWAISVDTETTTLHPEKEGSKIIAFCFGWDRGRATTILYEHPHAPPEYLERLDEVDAAVRGVLSSAKPKIFHNAKFDLKFLEERYNMKVTNVRWDTLLGEHLLDEDKKGNYGLKVLTAGWLPGYCGYEDKLHDLLTEDEVELSTEQLTKRIDDLRDVISEEHKPYIDALEAYKTAIAEYDSKKAGYDNSQAGYLGAMQGYAVAKLEHEELVREWKVLVEGWPKGKRGKPKKPTKWYKKPKKPTKLVRPREPKDPRSRKEKKVFTDAGYETLPLHDLSVYGCVDADVTRQLCQLQIKRIQKEKSRVNLLMTSHAVPVSRSLGRAEYRGTRIDQDYVDVLEDGLTKIIEETETELYRMASESMPAGNNLNLASTHQMGNILYNWGWTHPDGTRMDPYPVLERTDKNAPSTAESTLKQFLDYEDENKEIPVKAAFFIERYIRWKKAKKARDTFLHNIRILSRRDGFLHTQFHINGTGTGRLSSSDMNLQNIPKYLAGWNIKKLFIPDNDDFLFVNADYKGAEVRVFTAYARDEKLIEALNDGLDMHSFFASKVFKRPYEHYKGREDPDVISDPAYAKLLDKERSQIKRVVFGILYGAGPFKISETIGVDITEAKALIALLYEMFPAIAAYGKQVEREIQQNGYVETFFARRRRFPLARLSRHKHRANRQGKNFKIQSTSSDIVLSQFIEVDEHLRNEFNGSMLLTVHDSMGFQFPRKYIHQLGDFLEYHGVQRVKDKYAWLPVPFSMDIEVGENYGEVQSLAKYVAAHPFEPTPEGIIEENELLTELREDAFVGAA